MQSTSNAKDIVLSYINALYGQDYDAVRSYLSDSVKVIGPTGENFRSPGEFIEMMRKQQGKYDLKKAFVDGNDVCLLYDFFTPTFRTFFSSWYKVKDGKIIFIHTVFDTRAFQ
jgi:SnoaL-like domain